MSDIPRFGNTILDHLRGEINHVRTFDSDLPLEDRVCMIDLLEAEAILSVIVAAKEVNHYLKHNYPTPPASIKTLDTALTGTDNAD